MTKEIPDWSEKKILIAEDEFMGKKYLEKLLVSRRAKLQFANNGEEAVRAVKNERFDMVLMDLKMPVKNGFDATMEIKELHPDLPVIAQTALAYPADEDRARACGCDDLVTKPFHKNELISKMTRLIGS
ncbi:MAG: response regulator [Bacteroidales bacterium]|nr:response regulator [Bacteroidales bacterium]